MLPVSERTTASRFKSHALRPGRMVKSEERSCEKVASFPAGVDEEEEVLNAD